MTSRAALTQDNSIHKNVEKPIAKEICIKYFLHSAPNLININWRDVQRKHIVNNVENLKVKRHHEKSSKPMTLPVDV